MTHKNLISCVSSSAMTIDVRGSDVYLAILPLAHVLELGKNNYSQACFILEQCTKKFIVVEACLVGYGCAIGYGSTKTLTDAAMKNSKGDLAELRPTLMAGVPLIWERIRKGTLAKLGKHLLT